MPRYDRRSDHPQSNGASAYTRGRVLATLSAVTTCLVIVLLLVAGVLRMWDPVRWVGADATTLLYLGIPIIVLSLPRVLRSNLGKLSLGPTGISVELREIKEAAASAGEKAQTALASAELSKRVMAERLIAPPSARRGVLPPRRRSMEHARASLQDTAIHLIVPPAPPLFDAPHIAGSIEPSPGTVDFPLTPSPAPIPIVRDPDDPQRGLWGGRAERDGRVLRAKVTSVPNDPDWFEMRVWVESTPGAPLLQGQVVFHLHDSFADQDPVVDVVDGRAELRRIAWGAFTVGAEVDDVGTTLELDLATLSDADAPALFRSR